MATSRRDWQLEQMGIRQYRLTRPAALRGEVAITIPDDVKVIVICQTMPESASPLWLDLLRAMALTSDRVYCLMLDNVMMIPESVRCAFWLLGLDEAPALPSALQTLLCSTARLSTRCRLIPRRSASFGSRSLTMNTISSLTPSDLTAAYRIELASHAFP